MIGPRPLIFWVTLSLALHVAALAWCPLPNFFSPPSPVYLVVDLFSGPAISGTSHGLEAEPEGGGKPARTETAPTKMPLQKSPSTAPEPSLECEPKDLEGPLPTEPVSSEKIAKQELVSLEPKNVKALPERPLATATDIKTTAPAVVVTSEALPNDPDNLGQGPATADGKGTGAGTGSGPGSGPGRGGRSGSGSPVETPMAYGSNPPPPYPSTARRRGWEGEVLLLVHVTAGGEVCKVEVNSSSGYRILDSAAMNAVFRWRFKAARLNGRVVAGQVLVPIRFDLRDPK